MGRKAKADSGDVLVSEKKRKKVTTRRVLREHAGKVTLPYQILERLLEEEFASLASARFVLVWKSGWRADVDGLLTRARIKKASELERELLDGEEYDYAILLSDELWNETQIPEPSKEMDLYHELCHAAPEMDRDGEQKTDDRGRLCWRLRKHPIQEFPETVKRYGLKALTALNQEAVDALDDEKKRREAEADANDAERPILQAAQSSAVDGDDESWRAVPIDDLAIPAGKLKYLAEVGIETIGQFADWQRDHGEFWAKDIPGIGEAAATKIADALAQFWASRK